jgi:hypothetical protein
MTKNQDPNRKKANGLLWGSRIFASVVIVFFGLFAIPDIINGIVREGHYLPQNNKWEGVIITIWFCLLASGYILSWIKEGPGGIIMFLAGLTVLIPFIIKNNFGSFLFAIPSMAAGFLFIIYWRNLRRKKLSEKSH